MPRLQLPPSTDARLSRPAAAAIRAAIRLAGGREVCFVCKVDEEGTVASARVVARGDVRSVLALPGFAERGEMLVHNHPSGLLEPSNADLEVAARVHGNGVGFGIVDNDATELYVVVEVPPAKTTADIDPDSVDATLGPDGPIARRMRRYEDRPSQRAMASEIARLYNDGGVGLLEAGTGVGKSLGYLVPALRWAAANGERTIVSTNTINLQEQLVGKDLPFLAESLTDQKVRFALLKGWRNYLCLLRLEQARGGGPALLEEGMARELGVLEQWAERTSDGSVSDLPTPPRPEVWDEVSAEPDLCQRMKCPHFDRCFLFKARQKAAQADIIVVNHHLLLSDVAVRRVQQNWEDAAVLPAYKRLVVDEGHHLEDAAAAHLGASVTRRSLQRLFARLDRKGKGLLGALIAKLAEKSDLLSTASLDLVQARLVPAAHASRDKADLLFDLLHAYLEQAAQPVVRLTDAFAQDPVWDAGLRAALDDLLGEIELLHEGLRLVRERLESDEKRLEALAPLLGELRAVARRLQTAGDGLVRALRPADGTPPSVRWIELRGKERNVVVTSVPLDLAPILREDLFKRVQTAVITSATLATRPGTRDSGPGTRMRSPGPESRVPSPDAFRFLSDRLGLTAPEFEPATAIYPSPFEYPRQALLVVPSDTPAPNVDASAHFLHVVRHVLDVATASDGGMFVLFTSHRELMRAAAELRARGADRRWPLLVHGEDTRDALLNRFRESGRALLVGTASFWEGVDVPGDALRALVIAKLPFRVPSEPVTAAQCEAIEARGGDSFREYMLPHASLRLKQGFGRLIRTGVDRGVVVISDVRLVSKGYGRDLLDALPPARRVLAPWARARADVESFYAARSAAVGED
ncbi:helicase c2 [Gemmatirosa kalamazoonensis]|uniref:Helicase c2 n=1 Tax=Gemmatirosa kalamazoonensis TaxID=861299 RepID=W0RM50_9BACT|nr:helicase C-terminal domain-containing protein [Gemmatirosa kalamazoonensis]AHG90518.1 helicase c2 [Gemmatirosa kalamazoonensis]